MGLNEKISGAALWSIIDAVGKQVFQFVVSMILARLLLPEEFGTIAMLGIFVGIAIVLSDGGFSSALIQKKEITEKDLSSVFIFNVLISILMASTLCVSASWIAEYLGNNIFKPLTYLMAINVVIVSLGSVQNALFTKELSFKILARVNISATIISGIFCVILAANGFGIWSLALRTLICSLTTVALLWYFSSWLPKFSICFSSLGSLSSFGAYLLISGLLNSVYDRMNVFLIGKNYTASDAGLYARAEMTQQLPTNVLAMVLNRVAFPVFSHVNQDRSLLRDGVRKSIIILMALNIPMMVGLSVLAESVIRVVYGDKWLGSVPLLKILSLAGIFWPLHVIHLSVLRAQGHSKIFFWMDVIKKIVGVSILLYAATIGLEAIAWSMVIIAIISYFINSRYTKVFLNYSIVQQAVDLIPYVLLSGFMASAILLVDIFLPGSGFIKLLTGMTMGVGVYVLIGYFLKLPGFVMIQDFVKLILRESRNAK